MMIPLEEMAGNCAKKLVVVQIEKIAARVPAAMHLISSEEFSPRKGSHVDVASDHELNGIRMKFKSRKSHTTKNTRTRTHDTFYLEIKRNLARLNNK